MAIEPDLPPIEVFPEGESSRGHLRWQSLVFPCLLGAAGAKHDKREGDHATPIATMALRRALYRADRLPRPVTTLPLTAIAPDDGWCDDPADPAYNRPVPLPYPVSAEALWRADGLYDLAVVLGYNDDPVVPGKGSAIFLHVADAAGGPTEGCIALALSDLLTLIGAVDPATRLIVRPPS